MAMRRPRPAKKARRGRPLKNNGSPDMRERILDAAEDHFSRHGFWGVTLREVAQDAKVDTALLHYYFDTKRGLFDSVFARRAEIINRERIDSIDEYEKAAGDSITAEGVINAFLQPILERAARGDAHWHNYFALIAQVNNTPAWGGETMARTFDPVIHRLIRALRKALPDDGQVKSGVLPAGRYASLIFSGGGISGNRALIEWVRAQGLEFDRWDTEQGDNFRGRYETYLTDPRIEPRKSWWQIEVAIKLADK